MTTTTTIKQSEQTYKKLMEIEWLLKTRETQVLELKATTRVLLEQYLDEQAQEKEEEMRAEREARKAAAIAKLNAQYAAKLAALQNSHDEPYDEPYHSTRDEYEDSDTFETSVFEAGCEDPTSPPPQTYHEVSQGTFNEAAFMQEAEDAELARALAAEEAANFRDWQQHQQQKASHAPERHLPLFAEFLPEQHTQTQTNVKVHVEQTTTIATYCGKEGCHNVWNRNPEREAWTKQQVEAEGNKWCPRICCDECLAAKHAQQAQSATRSRPDGDNIKTSPQRSFYTTPTRSNPLRYGENTAWSSSY